MSNADLVANVERPEHERPVHVAPPVPDYVPPERPWVGSATGHVTYWRARALSAEGLVHELQRRLRHYRLGAL